MNLLSDKIHHCGRGVAQWRTIHLWAGFLGSSSADVKIIYPTYSYIKMLLLFFLCNIVFIFLKIKFLRPKCAILQNF